MALVAANDRAHVAGLLAAGASREEMLALRAADRAAQGVSAQDEAEAHRAIAARVISGDLTETTTSSATSSAIADLMLPELGGPGYHALLVVMPGKLAAFADGAAILRLAASVPGSYWGGDLPHRGFWGTSGHDLPSALAAARAAMGTDRPAGTPT